MTMLNTPMFFAAMPRTFRQDAGAETRSQDRQARSRKAQGIRCEPPRQSRASAKFLADHNPPPSYADTAYYGIHTFKFIDRSDKTTLVPLALSFHRTEKKSLSDAELKSMPADFLEQALVSRTAQGGARWDMLLTIGDAGDPEDDPTILWPTNRKELKAGTLTIWSAMAQAGAECEKINYDPLVMGDGIAATNDPVLLFRSPAYAWSFAKRLGGL